MYDMIGHIFGGLDTHERRITELERTAARKKAFGWGTVAKCVLAGLGIFVAGVTIEQVGKLVLRVDKLEGAVAAQKDALESALVEENVEE